MRMYDGQPDDGARLINEATSLPARPMSPAGVLILPGALD